MHRKFVLSIYIMLTRETISTLFDKYVEEDGFLYVAYGGESSFGIFSD